MERRREENVRFIKLEVEESVVVGSVGTPPRAPENMDHAPFFSRSLECCEVARRSGGCVPVETTQSNPLLPPPAPLFSWQFISSRTEKRSGCVTRKSPGRKPLIPPPQCDGHSPRRSSEAHRHEPLRANAALMSGAAEK